MRNKKFGFSVSVGENRICGYVEAISKERAMEKLNAFKDNFNLAAKTFDISFAIAEDEASETTNEMTFYDINTNAYDAIARSDNGYDKETTDFFNDLWNDYNSQVLMKKAIKILIERDMEEIASETENMNGNETYDEATKVFGCEDNLIDFYINRIADDHDRSIVINYAKPCDCHIVIDY